MIGLPPSFEGHERWQGREDDCVLCALWDEPAWFWHPEIPRPGSFEEQAARLREEIRLAGLELLALAERTIGRWLLRR